MPRSSPRPATSGNVWGSKGILGERDASAAGARGVVGRGWGDPSNSQSETRRRDETLTEFSTDCREPPPQTTSHYFVLPVNLDHGLRFLLSSVSGKAPTLLFTLADAWWRLQSKLHAQWKHASQPFRKVTATRALIFVLTLDHLKIELAFPHRSALLAFLFRSPVPFFPRPFVLFSFSFFFPLFFCNCCASTTVPGSRLYSPEQFENLFSPFWCFLCFVQIWPVYAKLDV